MSLTHDILLTAHEPQGTMGNRALGKKLGGAISCRAFLLLVAFFLSFSAALGASRTITIGSELLATYCDSVALDFRQSPVRAYGLRLEDGHLLRTPMLITPARVGMLLTADKPGTYNIPILSQPSSLSPLDAVGNELVGVLEDTRVPWISADDSARNYILQPEGFRRATGGILKAHKAYLHTDYDAGEAIDARLDQLIDQELESFHLTDCKLYTVNSKLLWFAFGVAIYFVCWWVIKKRRERK